MTPAASVPAALHASPPPGFEDVMRETLRRRIELAAYVLVAILTVAWIIGRIVLAGRPENAIGARWIPVQMAIALAAAATMRYLPAARRHPSMVGGFFLIPLASSVALHLGSLGGFDGPYFYAAYLFPPVTTILPCRMKARVFLAVGPPLAFALTYLVAFPHYFSFPMIHIPFVSLSADVVISCILGNAGYQITMERYALAMELERRVLDEARETERRSIARELHDDLAQLTTAARMEAKSLELRAAQGHVVEGDLAYLQELLCSLDLSSRRIVSNLRDTPEDASLASRIERMCILLERGASVRCVRRLAPIDVPAEPSEVVYRMVQEALTNALKHASATVVEVSLEERDGQLVVRVADDGRGFEVASRKAGFGLLGMHERIESVGGVLGVESGPRGSTITARLPSGRSRDV